ncbi:unnamed protein product [Bursaphelenchus okinawaensis]|uniref:Carboxylic ester hydrolase n=1 Tax=Bursaphelenchus okinawaensis TaxID=465554 RepID=A0A811L8D1_9BILA|nr:unnamed protein product [Bursaphelenchus okinawaensis]CAG9117761.1 unnamed protein product [Bursaphelenchus okinawaensis]
MSIRISDTDVFQIESGKIRGIQYNIDNCKNYAAFLGIPYAKAPIGELRFEKPQPVEKWRNVRNCKHFGAPCPYKEVPNSEHKPRLVHSEDCLFLNVFAPLANNQYHKPTNLPVFVFIHGGGYVFDNASTYGSHNICKNICSKDVIVVTINYRLGIFGFLTLNDDKTKGNYGLWDQTEALKWIQKNIESFGGDPNNVTVGGHSAGAASSDLLAISPHSRGLFHKLLLFGGASKCGFAMLTPEAIKRRIWQFLKSRGFTKSESDFTSNSEANEEILTFLKNLHAEHLKLGLIGLPAFKNEFSMHIAPVVDKDFFPYNIERLRKEAPQKEVLAGVTMFEGLNLAIGQSSDSLKKLTLKQIGFGLKQKNQKLVQEAYNNILGVTILKSDEEKDIFHVNILSDFFINNGVWESAKNWHESGSKVNLFTFNYIKHNMLGNMQKFLPFEAACHGVELAFLFGENYYAEIQFDRQDLQVLDRFTTFITDFIKIGPNSSLKTPLLTDKSLFKHTLINANANKEKDDFCSRRPQKWLEFKQKLHETSKL